MTDTVAPQDADTPAAETAPSVAAEARRHIRQHHWGVLSTQSVKYPGYPFGSVVPVCPGHDGQPLILISKLAQHTQNILQHPQVSLTLVDPPAAQVQAEARATVLADALELSADEIDEAAERYYRHFPECRGYHTDLDFRFFRLQPCAIRYIGGFGKIHWLDSQLLTPVPFTAAQERGMVEHMNEDHADALADYWRHAGLPVSEDAFCMVRMDGETLVIRHGGVMRTLDLLRPVSTPLEARQCLVEMARVARAGQ